MERSPHPRLRLSSRGGTRLRTKCAAPPSPPAAAFDQYYRQINWNEYKNCKKEDPQAPLLTLSFVIVNCNILLKRYWWWPLASMRCRGGKICHNVTRAEHASRKKCFVTLSPVSRGTKMEMYVCFCIWVVVAVNSAARKWKETLTSSLGRFDRLHGTGEKRTGWKWRPSPYFSIDSRWGCVTSCYVQVKSSISFYNLFYNRPCCLSWP